MSITLPLIQDVELVTTTDICEIGKMKAWYTSCKFKARYKVPHKTLNGTVHYVVCGRHYRMMYGASIDSSPNTIGMPAWVTYGSQKLWKMGTAESQETYLEYYTKTYHVTPGQFRDKVGWTTEDYDKILPAPQFRLTDMEYLPYAVLSTKPVKSPVGSLVNVFTEHEWRRYPLLCGVCGHAGVVQSSGSVNGKTLMVAHPVCRKWLNDHIELLDLILKPKCAHYVSKEVDDNLRAAFLKKEESALIECVGCHENFSSDTVAVTWSEHTCHTCLGKFQKTGMHNYSVGKVCDMCNQHYYYSTGFSGGTMVEACKLWNITVGRHIGRDIADYYTLQYLSIQWPDEVAEAKAELVSVLSQEYLNYACAACGGEFRYITRDYSPDEKATDVEKAVYKGLQGNRVGKGDRFVAWSEFKSIIDKWGAQALDVLVRHFPKTGGSIGGPRWANCTKVAQSYMEGKVSAIEFVDMVFGLQHNGGSFLNKCYNTEVLGQTLLPTLDVKRNESNPLNLLYMASPKTLDLWLELSKTGDETLTKGAKAIVLGRQEPSLMKRKALFKDGIRGE